MAAEIALWAAVAVAVLGAAWDIRTRRIPNWLVLTLAVFATGATIASGGLALLGSTALHALIVLLVGMGLFALKWVGAGDAKFYTAAALAIPLDRAIPMLGWVAIAGLVVMIGLVIFYRGMKIVRNGKKESWTLPYGVPIAFGFLATTLGTNLGLPF